MPYEVVLAPAALETLDELKAHHRAEVITALERHLRHEPEKVSKSRIKRLRALSRPQYRLRVGDEIRVYYDVVSNVVEVLGIVFKSEANEWLERHGEWDEEGGTVGD